MRLMIPGAVLAACACTLFAAGHDNNIEWGGISHVVWQDLRPLAPMRGDAFSVRFQALRGDLTGAVVIADVGGVDSSHAAALIGQVGPYDIWEAGLPGTMADGLGYRIELRDGTDADYLGPGGVTEGDPGAGGGFGLDFVTLEHAPIGATPVVGGTVFKVWSPTRTSCHVRGQFNGWGLSDPLTRVGEHFIGFVAGATAGQSYKYFFNNSVWNTDPRASSLDQSDNHNAVITDPLAYVWEHDGFIAPALDELVIYQLHVGSFSGRNDPAGPAANPSRYRDVGDRVAHLAELGVNAVMVNPINEFQGSFSGGYNPVSMYAWEWALGTPDDLKYMVDRLHGVGIAVILDTVWNHFGSGENFLWNYDGTQSYYGAPVQDTPWGPQADYERSAVFDYFVDSVHHTMGEFRMDGYRQDAVMAMTDSGWTAQWDAGQNLMRAMNGVIDTRYTDAHTIAELYIDSPWAHTGIGFDTQYHNSFKNALRDGVFGAAFGSPDMGAIAAAIDGTGGVGGSQVLNYFELHDDAWPLNGHERAVRRIDPSFPHDDQFAHGRTTLAQGLVLLGAGVPAILQGTEWLEDEGWEENKIDWAHKTMYPGVFDYYRALIGLRTGEPALFADAGVWVYHTNEAGDVLAFERWEDGGKSFVVVANLSNQDYPGYRLGLPRAGSWGVAVNNQWAEFGGTGAGPSGVFATEPVASGPMAQSASIALPARGLLVLEHDPSASACSVADMAEPLGVLNFFDVSEFLSLYNSQDGAADLAAPAGVFNFFDVSAFLNAYNAGCP